VLSGNSWTHQIPVSDGDDRRAGAWPCLSSRSVEMSALPDALDILHDLPTPLVVHDLTPDGRTRLVNPAFVQAFGYTLADIPGIAEWAARAYPDPGYRKQVIARWWSEIEARKATGSVAPASECRLVDKAGRVRNVLIGFALHGDVALVTFQDVTEIGQVRAALDSERRRTERTAHALTENMPAGAYTMVLPPGGQMAQFAFLSRRFLEMLGLTEDEAVGDPATGFSTVHPDDRPAWIALNAEAFANRRPFSGEARVVVRGETRWVRAESVPRVLEDGSTVWEGVLVDITQLKTAEQQLRSVLSAARAYTWKLDLRTGENVYDGAWSERVGLPPGRNTLSTAAWRQTVHPDDLPGLLNKTSMLVDGEIDSFGHVYRRRAADGQWLWVQIQAGVGERDPDGSPTVVSGVGFDITEDVTARLREQDKQAELREQLQRAQQRDAVLQVAGGVAHDLNNLIGLVMWTLETLEPVCADMPEASDGLARISRAVDMARDLIAGLSGAVRPGLPRARHDLRELMKAAADLLGTRRIGRHGLRLALPADALPVWANPTEVLQVIVNLAINACDSGGPDRAATVTLCAQPAGTPVPGRLPDVGAPVGDGREVAVFVVSDTGAGIPAEVRSQLFRRNYTTKGSAGTGLGLLIVARILQQNNAALWVDSTPGQGTSITVAWPVAAQDEDPVTPPVPGSGASHPARVEAGLLRGVQALVVDDLPDVAQVLASMLESAGAVAYPETDTAFVKEVLSGAPDEWSVLVTDLHMPGIDGHDLARFAAGLSPPVPVVLVTARPDTLGQYNLRDFAAVLAKPVSGSQLVEAVRQAASRRKT